MQLFYDAAVSEFDDKYELQGYPLSLSPPRRAMLLPQPDGTAPRRKLDIPSSSKIDN